MTQHIEGTTAAEIAESVRALVDRGTLTPGTMLPPVRALADQLGVNRNTAVAAYRLLSQAGVTTSAGRAGTRVNGSAHSPQDGYAHGTVLRDVGSGNPDPTLIPPLAPALAALADRPVMYGEPTIDTDLEQWARQWCTPDLAPSDIAITVTSGAVDAIERLLAGALVRDDAVGLEDPCFLASIHTVKLGGYRAVGMAVDAEGITPSGLRAALDAGVRAIVTTPRAQNPTGVTMTPSRAAELRAILAEHPYVLVIEDDHFSMLAPQAPQSIIGPEHQRFALVRSVSKFLGPDMGLAIVATDPHTQSRLAMRLSPGTTWVSHILQRLTLSQLTSPTAQALVADAAKHYAARNAAFASLLTARGIAAPALSAISLWVDTGVSADAVVRELMKRGWLARTEDEFALHRSPGSGSHVRLTVHDLADEDQRQLADDLALAITRQ
ncbi:aminotransferase class I/II-fold pyridoxal phosphate-dependent enzyme [Microbacterium sp. YY-03]|uniref:aminotransferase class I/II-fold pyridoxal phosphate-dependent enzyme n=1 Tax=Microbacterium sp. YY-03 TaxID=3421636 RepID=UPI003D168867